MHNKPLEKRSLAKIRQAIDTAKQYATAHKVPLTAERLAAELDMDLRLFHRIVEGQYAADSEELQSKVSAIQTAFCEATASVMEHAMQRGTSPNMHMLYLKENAGYGEKTEETPDTAAPVIFLGEDQLEE